MSEIESESRETVQRTLTGGEAQVERDRPDTFLWCDETEQWVLRSNHYHWPHELYESPSHAWVDSSSNDELDDDQDEEDDEPERVGALYEVELSYSVDFRFRIPAWSEHEAKERAGDLVDYPSNCADMFQVHSDDREIREILSDDEALPDDFDPYDGTHLWEVYGDD